MRWYANHEVWTFEYLTSNSTLLVIQESEQVVLDTLLIRPSDNKDRWKQCPDFLNMARLKELTVLGALENVVSLSPTSSFQLGFSLTTLPYEASTYKDKHPQAQENFEFQLNQQRAAAEHLLANQEGTLLWVNSRHYWQDARQYIQAWFTTSTKGFLSGTQAAVGAKVDDPKAMIIRFDPDHTSMALSRGNYSEATLSTEHHSLHDTQPLIEAKVQNHPYIAGV